METLTEYEEEKKIDYVVWRSLPTIMGYWFWLAATIYFWQFRFIGIDLSASLGLGIGITTWLLSIVLLGILGKDVVRTNMWDVYGCGCLAKVVAIPILPYMGILAICIWAYKAGSIGIIESIVGLIIGWTNWFLLSFLDT